MCPKVEWEECFDILCARVKKRMVERDVDEWKRVYFLSEKMNVNMVLEETYRVQEMVKKMVEWDKVWSGNMKEIKEVQEILNKKKDMLKRLKPSSSNLYTILCGRIHNCIQEYEEKQQELNAVNLNLFTQREQLQREFEQTMIRFDSFARIYYGL